jgi:hypothetical protein
MDTKYVWVTSTEKLGNHVKTHSIRSINYDSINGGWNCDLIEREKPLEKSPKFLEICDCSSSSLYNQMEKLRKDGWETVATASGSSGCGGCRTTYYVGLLKKEKQS